MLLFLFPFPLLRLARTSDYTVTSDSRTLC